MGIKIDNEAGQMTVEFLVAFPVMLIIAVIAVNVLLFLSECASFDRLARDAIRVYATSPGYGQTAEQSCAQIETALRGSFEKDYLDFSISSSPDAFGHVRYTATLFFSPTLFGMGLRQSIFGVELPSFKHLINLTVDSYKPGVLL